MTHSTCRLTAKNRDQLRNPTLGNRAWATCNFICLALFARLCNLVLQIPVRLSPVLRFPLTVAAVRSRRTPSLSVAPGRLPASSPYAFIVSSRSGLRDPHAVLIVSADYCDSVARSHQRSPSETIRPKK